MISAPWYRPVILHAHGDPLGYSIGPGPPRPAQTPLVPPRHAGRPTDRANRGSQGLPPWQLVRRGAYCRREERLPLAFFSAVARRVGKLSTTGLENTDGLMGRGDVSRLPLTTVVGRDARTRRRTGRNTADLQPEAGHGVRPLLESRPSFQLSCGAIPTTWGSAEYRGKGAERAGAIAPQSCGGLFREGDRHGRGSPDVCLVPRW